MSKEQNTSRRILRARQQLGISQSEAARKWNFSIKTLQAWEQGTRNPAGLYLEKLERILCRVETEKE